jgi:UDP-N-acetylmuramoylalanine--D-glutamate ligase
VSILNDLVSDLARYKKIAIFGYGVEGKSFHVFAKKYLPDCEIIIVDQNYSDDANYLDGLREAELVIKSPGISLYNLGIDYDAYNFTSITELFLKHFGSQIIGVTGTKGKSTLVTLIDSLLRDAGRKSLLCGNIGISPLEAIETIDEDTTVVMELSSHQLHHIHYSPHIAILTNLFAEHLDYYRDLQDYYEAKFNIFKYQKSDDIFICNLQNPDDFFDISHLPSGQIYNVYENELRNEVHLSIKNGYIHYATLQILEKLAEVLRVDESAYVKTVSAFKTLPHRLEFVDEINGVSYINDSISTIPQAAMEAVKVLKNVDTIILGGNDRGVDYSELVDFLEASDVQNIICFSDTGKQIYEKIKAEQNRKVLFYMHDLRESVKKASEYAKNVVLFSPAASSFNAYKNFAERGDEFISLVENLKG